MRTLVSPHHGQRLKLSDGKTMGYHGKFIHIYELTPPPSPGR